MKKSIAKTVILIALMGFLAVTFTSCHKDGCPGKITQIDQTMADENC